jgi:hypothetical protein
MGKPRGERHSTGLLVRATVLAQLASQAMTSSAFLNSSPILDSVAPARYLDT